MREENPGPTGPPAPPVPPAGGEGAPAEDEARRSRRGLSLGEILGGLAALMPLGLLAFIATVLVYASGIKNFGLSFWGFDFNYVPFEPASSSYGIGLFVVGSLLTAGLALTLATVLSLAMAISITVYLPPAASRVLTLLTDLLAGIPSVVFGIWGFVILAPYFGGSMEPSLRDALIWLPWFGGSSSSLAGGTGVLLAVFVLMIMVVPITTAVMREALRGVPQSAVEAGLALGATRWEVVRRVRLRMARQGIWGAIFLGFGRAFGESVAVAMLIGGAYRLPTSLYSGTYTVAAYIVDQYDSAFTDPLLRSLLVEFALILLLVSLLVNLVGYRLTHSKQRSRRTGREV